MRRRTLRVIDSLMDRLLMLPFDIGRDPLTLTGYFLKFTVRDINLLFPAV